MSLPPPGFTASSHVFFDVNQPTGSPENAIKGRLVFQLFDDRAPRTCANFRELCIGNKVKMDREQGGILPKVSNEDMRDSLASKMRPKSY